MVGWGRGWRIGGVSAGATLLEGKAPGHSHGRLTFWKLMRPVNVVAANDDGGKLKAFLVRMHHHLSCSLAGRVWVGWLKYAGFRKVVLIVPHLSVDLVGRHVDEALDAAFFGALEHHMCAERIGDGELVRVAKAQVDVRLGRKVEDCVDVMPLHALEHLLRVRDVALVEGEVVPVVEDPGVVQRGTVVEFVERNDVVGFRVCQGEVSRDPASTCVWTISMKFSHRDSHRMKCARKITYMKPAAPVIMMFLTSGRGSNLVEPFRTGASFHTPRSSKNRVWSLPLPLA